MQTEEVSGLFEICGRHLFCVSGVAFAGYCLCSVGAAVLVRCRLCREGAAAIIGRGFFCVGRAVHRFFAGAGSVRGAVDCVVVLGRGVAAAFQRGDVVALRRDGAVAVVLHCCRVVVFRWGGVAVFQWCRAAISGWFGAVIALVCAIDVSIFSAHVRHTTRVRFRCRFLVKGTRIFSWFLGRVGVRC